MSRGRDKGGKKTPQRRNSGEKQKGGSRPFAALSCPVPPSRPARDLPSYSPLDRLLWCGDLARSHHAIRRWAPRTCLLSQPQPQPRRTRGNFRFTSPSSPAIPEITSALYYLLLSVALLFMGPVGVTIQRGRWAWTY